MNSKSPDSKPLSQRSDFNDPSQEGMLVTGLIYMPSIIGEVMKIIPNGDAFQTEAIRTIYNVICEMYRDNAEIKKISVIQRLNTSGNLSAVKNAGLSLNFDHMTPSTEEQILLTSQSIVSMYRRQVAYDLNVRLNSDLLGDSSDEELAERVYKIYESLTMSGGKSLEKSSKDAAYGAIEQIATAMQLRQSGKLSGVPTGSNKIDSKLGGWQKDELIILGGRPGSGKTACALDFALGAAERDFPVGFFSIEMDSEQLNYRLAAAKTAIPYSLMVKGDITTEQFIKIQTALSEIAKLPIYYYDDSSVSNVHKLETIAVEWCRKKGVKLLIIDYIQYLQVNNKGGSYDRITAVSMAVKTMQRKLKVPVIALAQLGRKVEERPDPTPMMEDLKESGQLEQDASTVIGLLNVDYYTRKGKELVDEHGQPYKERSYQYVILKNRNGTHYHIERFCDIATNRFSDSASAFDERPTVVIPLLNNRVLDTVEPNF
jgi:replicative DNA helicase